MLQKLKAKYLRRSVFPILILLAAGIACFVFQMNNIKTLFAPAVNLDSIPVEDIKPGMKVEAEVYYVLDYFAYTTEDYTTVEKEYFIPVGEEEFMGLVASGNTMNDADDLMELTQEYLYGESNDIENAEPLVVTGTVAKMSSESLRFYRECISEMGYTADESDEYFLPYSIMVGDSGDVDTPVVIIVMVVGAVLIFLGIMMFVKCLAGSNSKKINKYLNGAPNREAALQNLERFYENEPEVNGIRVSKDYFLGTNFFTSEFCETKDIVWIYQYVLRQSVYFIPVARTYSIMVMLTDGTRMEVVMKGKKKTEQTMEHIARTLPFVYLGYSPELQHLYNTNRQAMIQAVAQKRAEILGNQDMIF